MTFAQKIGDYCDVIYPVGSLICTKRRMFVQGCNLQKDDKKESDSSEGDNPVEDDPILFDTDLEASVSRDEVNDFLLQSGAEGFTPIKFQVRSPLETE